jgi:hypothetical protein
MDRRARKWLIGFPLQCAWARVEIERAEAGECAQFLLPGVPCRCGAKRAPQDVTCKYPQCLGEPRELRCL